MFRGAEYLSDVPRLKCEVAINTVEQWRQAKEMTGREEGEKREKEGRKRDGNRKGREMTYVPKAIYCVSY